MSGHLLVGKWEMVAGKPRSLNGGALGEKVNGYIHFILYLDDGRQLALSDLRKFAKNRFSAKKKKLKTCRKSAGSGPTRWRKS